MKCYQCLENETETGLCLECDLKEWKDATKAANERFQLEERRNRQLSEQLANCEEALCSLEGKYLRLARSY